MRGGNDANTRVALGVLLGDGKGVVGGAVVPEQELEVSVGLRQDAVESKGEIMGAVVGGGDQGDGRGHGKRDEGWVLA